MKKEMESSMVFTAEWIPNFSANSICKTMMDIYEKLPLDEMQLEAEKRLQL